MKNIIAAIIVALAISGHAVLPVWVSTHQERREQIAADRICSSEFVMDLAAIIGVSDSLSSRVLATCGYNSFNGKPTYRAD